MTPTPVARIRYQLANDSRSGAEVARTRRVSSTALATSMPDRATSGPTARPVKRAMKSAHPQQTAVSRPNRTALIASLQDSPSGPGQASCQTNPDHCRYFRNQIYWIGTNGRIWSANAGTNDQREAQGMVAR